MDFTALRYFSETADARSVRAASERLHVSPSAISRQIAKLEHELRAPIFDRRGNGMTLTAAGKILQSEIDGISRELERAKSRIAALQGIQAGNVDAYCYQTAMEDLIAPVVQTLHARHPNLSFNVNVSSTDEALSGLVNGVIEVGLVVNPPVREAILTTELERDTIVAAVGPHHPIANLTSVSLHELARYPLLLMEYSFGLRQQVDKALNRYGITPNVFCVTNSLILVKEITRSGDQCTLIPSVAARKEIAEGTLIPVPVPEFADDPIVFSVAVLRRRSLSPAANVFLQEVIEYCGRRPPAVGQSCGGGQFADRR
jgi:DNA-binding transcriptional LysR family regulator